jgi:hypothetical protein
MLGNCEIAKKESELHRCTQNLLVEITLHDT